MEVEEKELAKRAKNGDKEAFEMLMIRYEKSLYNYIYRLTGERELSLDITQETFLKSYVGMKSFNPMFNFSTWLWRIAHNLVVDHFRKKKLEEVPLYVEIGGEEIEREMPSPLKTPYDARLNKERGKIIKEALLKLNPEFRELIILRHFNELSYQEISDITGLSFHSVKSKLFRAREALRKILEVHREAL